MIHVFVIEDDPDLLFLYHEALSKLGRTVTEVQDGTEALDILENSDYTPAVVFLDINMASGISGFKILETIHQIPRLAHTEVVIVTANDQNRAYAESKGVRHFRVKPFSVADITALADELCAVNTAS